MIFGIGTDIVCVKRMQQNIDRYGQKFAERFLTSAELKEYQQISKKAHFLARRFAAKEAAAKAIGLGFQDGLKLSHIGVGHNDKGKPELHVSEFASNFFVDNGIINAHISLADEEEHAVAFVTLEKEV